MCALHCTESYLLCVDNGEDICLVVQACSCGTQEKIDHMPSYPRQREFAAMLVPRYLR